VPTPRSAAARKARQVRGGEPRPPVEPEESHPASTLETEVEHEQTVEAARYDDADLADLLAERVEFLQCRFRSARLARSRFSRVRFIDCLVERSDLSNMRGDSGALERVRIAGSRMTGFALNDGLVRDVTFDDCKIDLTNWRQARFDAAVFVGCNLAGADFTDADLRGAAFLRCDLSGAQFHNATMTGARFRACELGGIGGITSWDGAVVHPDDLLGLAYIMAGALGIRVDPAAGPG
jgi:uncharacterized protein YjbI with pentapeptide repeats